MKEQKEKLFELEHGEVQYRHLSGWMKAAMVSALIVGALYLMIFIVGMVSYLVGVEY